VTWGLHHTYSCEITAANSKRPSHYHRAISRISKSKTFAKEIIQQRAKSFRDILPSFSQLVLEQNQALHNPAYVSFIFEFPTRHFEFETIRNRGHIRNVTSVQSLHPSQPKIRLLSYISICRNQLHP
jgi:hypothetical protein